MIDHWPWLTPCCDSLTDSRPTFLPCKADHPSSPCLIVGTVRLEASLLREPPNAIAPPLSCFRWAIKED
ncbi:hypothetical protein VNO78_23991 [Psophocarpus tetragonolobus]|uniref:Uncharacterized protein n=1 Tax=Psophocarpus tetragonolobus TaxID=3891 RepID=A0AAN9XED8_PSOTE